MLVKLPRLCCNTHTSSAAAHTASDLLERCRYSATVTGALNRLLEHFIVDNSADKQVLDKLAQQIQYQHLTVYTMGYDIPQHTVRPEQQPAQHHATVFRLLSVRLPCLPYHRRC